MSSQRHKHLDDPTLIFFGEELSDEYYMSVSEWLTSLMTRLPRLRWLRRR